jgi:high affinity sulfate transporter 1
MNSEPAAPREPRPIISVLEGIRPYDRSWLQRDVVAGITLAALAIPEVMGYTRIAGMPVITGLYTILIPVVVFALLGSSRHLVVGADSATAAIMYAGIAGLGVAVASPRWVALAALSALLAGALLLLARIVRLGFLADFLSRTVLIGFLTGVGVQVAIGQVGGMLGVPAQTSGYRFISGHLIEFFKTLAHVGDGSWQTALVSAATLAILVVFGRWIKLIPAGLVAVVAMIAASYAFDFQSHDISVLGPVPSGLPSIGFPSGLGWGDVGRIFATSASMFIVILAQSAATSRAYAVRYSERFEENTDLVGLGLANVAASLSSAFPVNGSPTKTEMVDEARSRTQVAQLTTAAVTAIVLLFLTKPLQYMPNAVLSAVVFLVGVKLIHVVGMRKIYALRRGEFWIAAFTAVVVVGVGVEQGIVVAVVLSLIAHVRRHYDPHNAVVSWDDEGMLVLADPGPGVRTAPGLVVYRFGVGIFYANAERLAEQVIELVSPPDPPRWLVLQADAIDDVDYTGAEVLLELADQLKARGVVFALASVRPDVRKTLDRFGFSDKIGVERYYPRARDAVKAFHAT